MENYSIAVTLLYASRILTVFLRDVARLTE